MKYEKVLSDRDRKFISTQLDGFIPEEIYDIHTHPYEPSHFAPDAWHWINGGGRLGCEDHRNALLRYMPVKKIHGLYFGMPHRSADNEAMNKFVLEETKLHGSSLSRALKVVTPNNDPVQVARELREGLFCGIKVYHVYAARPDTMNASITEFAPEWMWEILHETNGILMLHIVRNGAIEDADNQKEIRRLCRTYPKAQLVLAHIARSFNYRNGRNGLHTIADLDNVVVDTSAICETESFRAVLEAFGPRRILWGSDFAVSEARGRCVTTGSYFSWLFPDAIQAASKPATENEMTLIGIESLVSLRELSDDAGLTKSDIKDIFLNNALRLLKPFLPTGTIEREVTGPELWKKARTIISGGTGLLSKRAEMFDTNEWPAYFSRAKGCEVWDLADKRYIDFAGGIGAVLLGYNDPDITAAVRRRLTFGTYCSLVNPQEVELAEILLELHPWANKVRYARSGGEAMAVAVRIARASIGKSGIAFCGYHGWHDWYLAANLGETQALDGHLLPGLEPKGVPVELRGTSVPFHYNDLDSLDATLQQLNGNLAAVVMEPMRSQEPKDDFIAKVAAKCHEAGAVLIVDEITSGLRYGFPGALSRIGLNPDMVVYAKAMGNGFPFATIIGRDEIMSAGEDSFISSSYWTDGIGTAAALAVLQKMERLDVYKTVWNRGLALQEKLKGLAARYPGCQLVVGGLPSTPNLQFQLGFNSGVAQKLYVRKMHEQGILVSSIFYLMYAHQDNHIAQLLETLEKVMKEIEQIIKDGQLETQGAETSSQKGFARLA
jgi:glutamate-1-semialdehyde 2,1-aminomutase